MVILVDDADRENEGDLVLAAQFVTPEAINFMAKYARGVICEVMNDDGTMARMPDLTRFAREHGLHILSVADVIQYRMHRESLVRRGAEARVPTEFGGDMRCIAYENDVDSAQHVAFVKGSWEPDEPVLVRVHSKCLTGDVFGSRRCHCGPQ